MQVNNEGDLGRWKTKTDLRTIKGTLLLTKLFAFKKT